MPAPERPVRHAAAAPAVSAACSDAELLAIQRLRYDVYVAEQGKPYPEADHAARLLADRWDARSSHFQLVRDGELVAAVRHTPASAGRDRLLEDLHLREELLVDTPSERFSVTSRLVSRVESRGMMRALRDLLVAIYLHGVHGNELATFIHCRSELVPFFARLGFRAAGAPFVDAITHRTHLPMVIVLDEVMHLEATGSPFTEEARRCFPDGPRTESRALLARLERIVGGSGHRGIA